MNIELSKKVLFIPIRLPPTTLVVKVFAVFEGFTSFCKSG